MNCSIKHTNALIPFDAYSRHFLSDFCSNFRTQTTKHPCQMWKGTQRAMTWSFFAVKITVRKWPLGCGYTEQERRNDGLCGSLDRNVTKLMSFNCCPKNKFYQERWFIFTLEMEGIFIQSVLMSFFNFGIFTKILIVAYQNWCPINFSWRIKGYIKISHS